VDGLAEHLGGPRPLVEALIASDDEAPIGFALFYTTFSTFRGAPGLWLEDIYVRPSSRGVGAGRALLAAVARVAAERGHARVQWAALDWNQQALGFYRGLGAEALPQWVWHRLEGEAMRRLAGEAER